MQGRPSHHIKAKQGQHTRPFAGGQSLTASGVSGASIFKRCANPTISKLVGYQPNIVVLVLHNSLRVAHLRSPVLACSSGEGFYKIFVTPTSPVLGYHPFGSIPRCCSSFLRIRFIQVAREESPSLRISSSSCERKSSFKRIGNCGDRFSGIDMVYAIGDIERVYTSVYALNVKKQRPGVVATLPRRLTTIAIMSNEAAMKEHTTHPQGRNNYTWRFLALNRHDKKAIPCRLSVEAPTEREARRILAPHFILSLAARLPVQEVSHG